jgi:hypothetical protein
MAAAAGPHGRAPAGSGCNAARGPSRPRRCSRAGGCPPPSRRTRRRRSWSWSRPSSAGGALHEGDGPLHGGLIITPARALVRPKPPPPEPHPARRARPAPVLALPLRVARAAPRLPARHDGLRRSFAGSPVRRRRASGRRSPTSRSILRPSLRHGDRAPRSSLSLLCRYGSRTGAARRSCCNWSSMRRDVAARLRRPAARGAVRGRGAITGAGPGAPSGVCNSGAKPGRPAAAGKLE